MNIQEKHNTGLHKVLKPCSTISKTKVKIQISKFERRLKFAIRKGHYKHVRRMLQQKIFKQQYKDEWMFKLNNQISPLNLALSSKVSKTVDILLQNGVYVDKDTLFEILQKVVKKNNKELLNVLIKYIAKNIDFHRKVKFLYKILANTYFELFESSLDHFSITPYEFFHTLYEEHFPFMELCLYECYDAIFYLLERYNKDTLNIECNWDTFYKKVYRLRRSKHWNIPFSFSKKEYVTCPEQELLFCLFNLCSYSPDSSTEMKRIKLAQKLFELDFFSDASVFNNNSENTYKHFKNVDILKLQNNCNLFLRYICMNGDSQCLEKGLKKIEGILNNDKEVSLLFYKEAMWSFHETRVYNHCIYKWMSRFILQRGHFLIMDSKFLISTLSYWKFDIVRNCEFQNVLLYLYRELYMKVNPHDMNKDSMIDILIKHYRYDMCHDNVSKLIFLMYAAGETHSIKYKFHYDFLKAIFPDKKIMKDIAIDVTICPYSGPGGKNWLEPLMLNRPRVPRLIEITRKTIRDAIYKHDRAANMFLAIRQLSLPSLISEYLLFNVQSVFKINGY